jgi:hypothetical protein
MALLAFGPAFISCVLSFHSGARLRLPFFWLHMLIRANGRLSPANGIPSHFPNKRAPNAKNATLPAMVLEKRNGLSPPLHAGAQSR